MLTCVLSRVVVNCYSEENGNDPVVFAIVEPTLCHLDVNHGSWCDWCVLDFVHLPSTSAFSFSPPSWIINVALHFTQSNVLRFIDMKIKAVLLVMMQNDLWWFIIYWCPKCQYVALEQCAGCAIKTFPHYDYCGQQYNSKWCECGFNQTCWKNYQTAFFF